MLEDLGSRNGTFLGGHAASARARSARSARAPRSRSRTWTSCSKGPSRGGVGLRGDRHHRPASRQRSVRRRRRGERADRRGRERRRRAGACSGSRSAIARTSWGASRAATCSSPSRRSRASTPRSSGAGTASSSRDLGSKNGVRVSGVLAEKQRAARRRSDPDRPASRSASSIPRIATSASSTPAPTAPPPDQRARLAGGATRRRPAAPGTAATAAPGRPPSRAIAGGASPPTASRPQRLGHRTHRASHRRPPPDRRPRRHPRRRRHPRHHRRRRGALSSRSSGAEGRGRPRGSASSWRDLARYRACAPSCGPCGRPCACASPWRGRRCASGPGSGRAPRTGSASCSRAG